MSTPIYFQSLSDTVRQLKSGALSSEKLTETMLTRVHALDGGLHAYARTLDESALLTARSLDAARRAGQPLGALHGVPVAIKDLLFTRGIATASGTAVMADFRPDFDATVVTKLKAAGAVIIGKTQLTEGAYGNHHPDIAAPVNPWRADAWPGVSSSGSGVAVAAGMAFAALGSDTGGSIRFPSACCGLVGLKPTYGRVSLHGAFPLANSLDHIGPLTRSVEDAARMLLVIAGEDSNDPNSLQAPVSDLHGDLASLDPAKVHIGVDWHFVSAGVAPAIVAFMRSAVEQLNEIGFNIVDVTLPESYQTLAEHWPVTCGKECAATHASMFASQRTAYGPGLAALIEFGQQVTDRDYAYLETVRAAFRDELQAVLNNVDVLISPCMTMPSPLNAEVEAATRSSSEQAQTDADNAPPQAPFVNFTAPFDYSGHPTLNLPMGLDARGLPQALQFVGPLLGESKLLRIAAVVEAACSKLTYPDP